MGSVATFLPQLGSIGQNLSTIAPVLGTVSQIATSFEDPLKRDIKQEQDLALAQLQARQQADLANLEQQTQLEREKLDADATAAEQKRTAALRRAVARQRVNFASQGLGGSAKGGSSEAVLLGLFEESDDERTERTRLDDIRSRALDQDISSRRQLNVLQRTQLQQRQNLERELL